MNNILVVDDERKLRLSLSDILNYKGYHVKAVANGYQALESLQQNEYDCILLDVVMPGLSGIDLLKKIHQLYPHIPVIMVSGYGTIETAIKATKMGAYDFLEKPAKAERLLITLDNAIKNSRLINEREQLIAEIKDKYSFIGQSNTAKRLFETIDKVAPTNAKVLITGETGVGKELVAHAIHKNSKRRNNNFIKVNCAAIPKDLIESELFGHKKGSFTSAINDHKGKFIEASNGTIFLDEIGELEPKAQAKLLQVLQDDEVTRIGDNESFKIDVRVIAATNKNINREIKNGNFREDLYFRLNVAQIHIPPLRDRKDDIHLLVKHYVQNYCDEHNKRLMEIPDSTMEVFFDYEWPGNVRELKNTLEKIVIFSSEPKIYPGQIIDALQMEKLLVGRDGDFKRLNDAKYDFEKRHILKTLNKTNWKIKDAAKLLGIDRTNLFKKMKKHHLVKPD